MTQRPQAVSEPSASPQNAQRVPASPAERVAVTLQIPAERHDYTGDLVTGSIGLLAGVIGALVGARAAYHFGLKAAREARDEDRKTLAEERAANRKDAEEAQKATARARDKSVSFALVYKLNRIYGTQNAIKKKIEEGRHNMWVRTLGRQPPLVDRAVHEVAIYHLCLEVRPYANLPARVTFTPEEVECAGRVGGDDALGSLMVMDDRHNAAIELLGLYRELHLAFEASVDRTGEYDGVYMAHAWTVDDYRHLRPRLDEMDQLLDRLYDNVVEDEQDTFKALKLILQGKADKELGAGPFRFPDPEGTIIVIPRKVDDEPRPPVG